MRERVSAGLNYNLNEPILFIGPFRKKHITHLIQSAEKGLIYEINLKYSKIIIKDILNRIEHLDLSVDVILIVEDIDKFIYKKIYDSIFKDISRLIKSPSFKFVCSCEDDSYLDLIKEKLFLDKIYINR